MMKVLQALRDDAKNYGLVLFGNFLFAAGVNLFIVPLGLYSGGIIGIAQIIRTVLVDSFGFTMPGGFDIAGILNLLLNIPLFLMAYRSISRKFFVKTLFGVLVQTLFLTLIMIPSQPILDDVLAACLIGGIVCGVGIGFTLRAGGSGGGIDILGVYFTMKHPGISVGKLGIGVNAFVYGVCALLFELPVAIYSILYTACMALSMDKVHYQNINTSVMIFTKEASIKKKINQEMGRGVTYWNGAGAYTDEATLVLVTVISKYEISTVKKIIYGEDPKAFVIFNEGLNVTGNFEKRL